MCVYMCVSGQRIAGFKKVDSEIRTGIKSVKFHYFFCDSGQLFIS